MKIEYDESKNSANIAKHVVSFARVVEFSFDVTKTDERFDYGEIRYISYGVLDTRIHVLIWTSRSGGIIRPISFRKANRREQKLYEI
jgi:uncharacterized DUF497 family protein